MQPKLKCLIIDDEDLALDILQEHISKIEFLELVARCNTAVEAYNILSSQPIDIIFIDIQMPEITGTDFIRNLSNPPKVIFTTAYREYAVEGFDLNATDYLLKPISFQRFLKAVNKLKNTVSENAEKSTPEIKVTETNTEQFFYIKSGKKMVKIVVDDILYVESLTSFVYIHTINSRLTCYKSISEFERNLKDLNFIRIHRAFLVAVKYIEAYSANHVEVMRKSLPVGRLYKNEVIQKLNQFSS